MPGRERHDRLRRGTLTGTPASTAHQYMRLAVATLLFIVLVGVVLCLRGAPGLCVVLIASAVPLSWWASRRDAANCVSPGSTRHG